jgi:hypothetical protein
MRPEEYLDIKQRIIAAGYESDVSWSEEVRPPANAGEFATEFVFVVCNSGMKAQIAVPIFHRVMVALKGGRPVTKDVFGHVGKVGAIEDVWSRREEVFRLRTS